MGSGKGNPELLGRRRQAGPHPVRAVLPRRGAGPRAPSTKAIQKLPIKARFVTREEAILMAERPRDLRELTSATWSSELARVQAGGVQPALPARHRPARQHRRIAQVRRQIARINTLIRSARSRRPGMSDETRDRRSPRPRPPRRGLMADETATDDGRPRAAARSARASSCRAAWTRPPSSPSSSGCATRSTTRSSCGRRSCTCTTRPTTSTSATGSACMETRPLSKLKRWRVIEVLERAKWPR